MAGIDEQIEIFKLIGRQLKKKTECYVIGGSAMLFYGFKTATKDVDIVFTSEEGRAHFTDALKEIGFGRSGIYQSNKGQPILMQRKEERFDLFLENVLTTKFSPGMESRIKEKHEFSNLIASVVSPEDIIVLKCATDRAGDRKDVADIVSSKEIDWSVVLEEAKWQAENGKKAFVVLLFDFVSDLRDDYKAAVPRDFLKDLRKEYKAQLTKILGREKYRELASRGQKKK